MSQRFVFLAAITTLLVLPLATHAAVFLVDEDALSLPEPVSDDIYAAGKTIYLNKAVTGDVVAVGQTVSITAPVSQNIVAAGEHVEISGSAADDVAVAGNTITISASNTDDLFAAGNSVTVTKDATVSGDAYLGGETIDLSGNFRGNVRASSNALTVRAGTIIDGNLTTFGGQAPVIEEGATIRGETAHRATPEHTVPRRARFLSFVTSVLMWFVAGLIALYGLPALTTTAIELGSREIGRSLLTGLLWLMLFIPLSILLATTVIGIPLMIIILCSTGALLVAAMALTSVTIGKVVMQRALRVTTPISWQHVLVGAVLYVVLWSLPLIGFMAMSILIMWMFGALVRTVWQLLRRSPQPQAPSTTV